MSIYENCLYVHNGTDWIKFDGVPSAPPPTYYERVADNVGEGEFTSWHDQNVLTLDNLQLPGMTSTNAFTIEIDIKHDEGATGLNNAVAYFKTHWNARIVMRSDHYLIQFHYFNIEINIPNEEKNERHVVRFEYDGTLGSNSTLGGVFRDFACFKVYLNGIDVSEPSYNGKLEPWFFRPTTSDMQTLHYMSFGDAISQPAELYRVTYDWTPPTSPTYYEISGQWNSDNRVWHDTYMTGHENEGSTLALPMTANMPFVIEIEVQHDSNNHEKEILRGRNWWYFKILMLQNGYRFQFQEFFINVYLSNTSDWNGVHVVRFEYDGMGQPGANWGYQTCFKKYLNGVDKTDANEYGKFEDWWFNPTDPRHSVINVFDLGCQLTGDAELRIVRYEWTPPPPPVIPTEFIEFVHPGTNISDGWNTNDSVDYNINISLTPYMAWTMEFDVYFKDAYGTGNFMYVGGSEGTWSNVWFALQWGSWHASDYEVALRWAHTIQGYSLSSYHGPQLIPNAVNTFRIEYTGFTGTPEELLQRQQNNGPHPEISFIFNGTPFTAHAPGGKLWGDEHLQLLKLGWGDGNANHAIKRFKFSYTV